MRAPPAGQGAGSLRFLADGGDCGARLRAADWSRHPLGAPAGWPVQLKTLVAVMLGASQPMFVAWGAERTILYNDGYAGIVGERHPRALGAPFAQVWHDIMADVGPILDRAFDGVATHMDDIAFLLPRNGRREEAHFSFSHTPVRDDAGDVVGMFCACTETTRQVLDERRLAEHAKRQQRLFQAAPGFIAIMRGPEHRFEFVNDAYGRLFQRGDVLGRTVREVFPEVEAQGLLDVLDGVYASGERFVGERLEVTLRAGPQGEPRPFWLDFIFEPMRDDAGRVDGVFVVGHDVSSQRRTERALQDEARRKDEFLAMLSHELRNPLAPIRNGARLLRATARDDPRVAQVAAMVERQVAHMARLVDDLLDVSRLTRGLLAITTAPVRIDEVVEGALEQVGPQLEARRQTFARPSAGRPLLVDGDRVRLVQVLSNLLDNASKHSPEGGSVSLEVGERGGCVELRVRDDGDGIDPAFLPHVFDLFSQADRSIERGRGGLGLGLSLANALVRLHGGRLEAHSDGPGTGATFVVALPCRRDAGTIGGPIDASAAPR